ncbi:hypothetical protein [Leifsonia aquatica]|uniref:hypothetical protein n=1 Tax=Leifsonia aquatica TaxID=144185 RepID=UPI0004688753|nr:hypothetical protein [Leifsonia aquatica]
MTLPGFATDTVIRLRYPTIRDHGVERIDYTATPYRHPIDGCYLEPLPSVQVDGGRTAISNGWTLAAPPGSDIIAGDHIEYVGIEYGLNDGDPQHIGSPTGRLARTQATITVWNG